MIERETERLRIRNFHSDDILNLHELAIKYEASEYSIYDHKWPQTKEGIREAIEWFSSSDSYLAVELKKESKVIGLISLPENKAIMEEKIYGFGYVFNIDYQGKGYAYESCIDWCRDAESPFFGNRCRFFRPQELLEIRV